MGLVGFDTLTPSVSFELLMAPPNITGKDLERRLMRFEYLDEPRKKPQMEMQFDNSDGKIVNLGVLFIGLKMIVTFGYEGLRSRPFQVTVTKIKAAPVRDASTESPAPGAWGMVTMFATPEKTKLHWRPEVDTGVFRNMKLSTAIQQIARDQGYRESCIFVQEAPTALGSEPVFDEVAIHDNETVKQFLERTAEERGFFFWATDKEFHWHQDGWRCCAVESIEYFNGPDLLDFSIDGDYNTNVRGVKGKALDWRKRFVIMMDVKPDGGVERGVAMPDNVTEYDVITAIPEKVRMAAAKRLIAHSSNRWLVRTSLIGNPRVMRGKAINLANFGPFIDGCWYVRSCRHTLDNSGYTTDVGLKRAPISGGGAVKVRFVIMMGEDGERGVAILTDQSVGGGGRKKKGRYKSEGPGRNGRSHKESGVQKRAANAIERSLFHRRRGGRS